MNKLLFIVYCLFLSLSTIMLNGFIGMKIWNWFAPELTSNNVTITWPVAMGFLLFVYFVKYILIGFSKESLKTNEKTFRFMFEKHLEHIIAVILLLFWAWLVTLIL